MDKEIVKIYSENDNIDICIEECSELIHALSKYKRSQGYGYLTNTTPDKAYIDLVQAVADALNAIESVSYKMRLSKHEIDLEMQKANVKAHRNLYGETEESGNTLTSTKKYWFKKALTKEEENQMEDVFHPEKYTMKSEKSTKKQGKDEFHCEKIDIKNHDAVNHPSHYCIDGIECIDVIKATTKGMPAFDAFCQGNAMKYLFRWQYKNGVEDLKNAKWYIDKLIEGFEK